MFPVDLYAQFCGGLLCLLLATEEWCWCWCMCSDLSLNALYLKCSLPCPLARQVLLNLFCRSGFVFTEEVQHGFCFSCLGIVHKYWCRGWKWKELFGHISSNLLGLALGVAGRFSSPQNSVLTVWCRNYSLAVWAATTAKSCLISKMNFLFG